MSANMPGSAESREPLGKAAVAVWTALWLLAAVLLSRRLSGAFTASLSGPSACLATTMVGASSLAALLLYCRSRRDDLPNSALVSAGLVALLPMLAVGGALAPRSSTAALAYLAGLCVVLTAAAVIVLFENARVWREPLLISGGGPDDTEHSSTAIASAHSEPHDRNVTQWFKRHADGAGSECVEGSVRVPFGSGQKQAVVHVPFSPPLGGIPRVECEPLDASQVRVKVAAVHAYGARLEARRSGSLDQPATVELGFSAVVAAILREAA